jgi:hypothetical protein
VIRGLLLNFIALLLIASCGWGLCVAAGWDPHASSLIAAIAIAFVASIFSLLPLWLARSADQLGMAQAALVSTIVHLFVAIVACGAVVITKPLAHVQSFVYWAMAFYFATLIIVASMGAKAVRGARRVETNRPAEVVPASVNRE